MALIFICKLPTWLTERQSFFISHTQLFNHKLFKGFLTYENKMSAKFIWHTFSIFADLIYGPSKLIYAMPSYTLLNSESRRRNLALKMTISADQSLFDQNSVSYESASRETRLPKHVNADVWHWKRRPNKIEKEGWRTQSCIYVRNCWIIERQETTHNTPYPS
jgi:hypothetical protein